jgi:RIP metalloprotease RseP
MTGELTRPPRAPEHRGDGEDEGSGPRGTLDGDRSVGWYRNRPARLAGLVLFVVLVVMGGAALGATPWALPLVVLPVVVAMVAAELDDDRVSGWARVAAVTGLVVLLAVSGGAPLLIVVGAVIAMIFLHELGHYVAARRGGMKVTEFFLGFGTRIWSFRRGETEFGLKAIPGGAYVKILGMNNLEEVDPADEARTYRQASFGSRASVAVAGSAMHFLIALVLLFVQFAFIGSPHETRWTVRDVSANGAAAAAGVQEGDRLTSLGGRPVGSFDDFRDLIRSMPTGPATLVLERDGNEEEVTLDLAKRMKVIGTVGEDLDLLETSDGVIVGPLVENGRGERSGLSEGDPVAAVAGVPVDDFDDVGRAIEGVPSGVVAVEVAGGALHEVDLGSEVDITEPSAFLGVSSRRDLVTEPVHTAVGSSVAEFGRMAGASVVGVATVFWPPNLVEFFSSTVTGTDRDVTDEPTPAESVEVSTDAGRPTSIIGAVSYGADLTSENLSNLVGFLIGLNIFIGVFNLIPLLPFDGGHLSIAVYEKAQEMRRRSRTRYIADVSRMIPVAYTVVMVLVVVGLMAMYLDLTRGITA